MSLADKNLFHNALRVRQCSKEGYTEIPACAGMTTRGAGMVTRGAGMTPSFVILADAGICNKKYSSFKGLRTTTWLLVTIKGWKQEK